MKSSQKDLAAQLKIALIAPALFAIVVGILGFYQAVDMVGKVLCAVLALLILSCIVAIGLILPKRISDKIHWLTGILDSIPFPISVTDMQMNWTFINKPVEDLLKTTRANVMGMQCSHWGASICKTEQCGIACLKKNIVQTTFEQMGLTYKVDTAYLYNSTGNAIGHIEVVQDISALSGMKQLETLLHQIEQICPVLSSSAEQVASSAQTLAQGATEQAAAVEQLSASVRTISTQVKDNAEHAQKADDMAMKATTSIQNSNQQMGQLMSSMTIMESKSHEISKIIKTIEDIAFQTNILALNAAVEAARAGVAGKGFAVVADEVRNLAAKSADAAKSTTALIEDSVSSIAHGVHLAEIANRELHDAVQTVISTTVLISQITKASGEQARAVSQVSIGVDEISSVVHTNSATSEQTAAASEELSSQADMLWQLTQEFKVDAR